MDIRIGFFAALLVVLGSVSVLLALPLLQYVMAAALLAYVLFPLHDRLAGRSVRIGNRTAVIYPRLSAGFLTLFAIVVAILPLLILSVIVLQTVISFAEDLGGSNLLDRVRELALDLGVSQEALADMEARFPTEIDEMLDAGLDIALQELTSIANLSFRVGLGLLVFIFLLYYFLVDGRRLVAWTGTVAPLEDQVYKELVEEVDIVTQAVIKSHVLVAITEGVLGGIGLYLLGVPSAGFWTVMMIIVSFLPGIGIWLVWGPATGYLVFIGEPVAGGLLLVYGIVVLSVVDNYLRAILVDRESGVHPAVVLVGVIGGLYLFGILGLFLGPVLLAVTKAAFQVFGEVYTVETTKRDDLAQDDGSSS